MSIKTWVGRFSIVEGQVREEGPWLGAFHRRLAEEESRDLYVLAEPALPGSEEFCGDLVQALGTGFQKESLSLTGALLRSLRAAHEDLREWNRKSLREHQVAAGAGCLLLRGRTAYLAQVGPSLAYFYRDGQVTTITPQDEGAQAPLGLADEFQPEITRYDLEPGDLLLVTSSRLADVADEPTVAGALARGLDDALPEVFLLTRDLLNFSALLAACFLDAEEPPPEPVTVPEHFAVRAASDASAGADGAEDATSPVEAPGEPDEDPPHSAVSIGGGFFSAAGTAGALAAGGFAPGRRAGGAPVAVMGSPRPGLTPFGSVAGLPAQPASRGVVSLSVRDGTSSEGGNGHEMLVLRVDSPPPGMERPLVRLRGEGAAPRTRYKRTTTTLPRIFPVPRLAVLAALAVLTVALVAWFAVPRSVQENREARFVSLMADARGSLQAAPGLPDGAERRELLSGALADLDEAASIYPEDGQVQALRVQAQAAMSDLDAVVDLGELRLVADLDLQLAGEPSLQQVVVADGVAFLLDAAEGRVVELPLQEGASARVVLEEGELAGAVRASRPLHILWWQPEGERGRLLILDDQRRLFSLTPGGRAAPLILRDAEEWGSLDAAATFAGSLYVLDVASNQVWRYAPTDAGFDSERSGLLGQADLSGAMALAVDGDVYLLTEEGGVRRFASGVEKTFAMAGIDRGLVAPASLTGDGQGGLLVVDRGNKRLVSLSPRGRFQAQFVSRTFTDLRSTAVDAGAGLLYALVGDSLYVTELP
jgi:hypothetical protein